MSRETDLESLLREALPELGRLAGLRATALVIRIDAALAPPVASPSGVGARDFTQAEALESWKLTQLCVRELYARDATAIPAALAIRIDAHVEAYQARIGRFIREPAAHPPEGGMAHLPPLPHTCPTCGFVMCEQFDDKRLNAHATLATPNGTYRCYHCYPLGAAAPLVEAAPRECPCCNDPLGDSAVDCTCPEWCPEQCEGGVAPPGEGVTPRRPQVGDEVDVCGAPETGEVILARVLFLSDPHDLRQWFRAVGQGTTYGRFLDDEGVTWRWPEDGTKGGSDGT